ncbi:ABC transporter permease [Clostridium sediminicola]|uniref:ABC transporter permease n=1 Tax=Clostridium sediminicola TaxID=3114879 RepID=UPI0031F2526C
MLFSSMQGAVELGIIYAIMALGVFLSFRTLNIPDLTVDSSFTLGASVSAMLTVAGHPYLALLVAFLVGSIAGSFTALLNTKLKIQPLLAGILMMLALYSINLRVMGNKANINLLYQETIFSILKDTVFGQYRVLIISTIILICILLMLYFFLGTEFGFVLRATGDNPDMVKAYGANTDFTILIGLALSNGLVALTGALIAQNQLFADISMGVGMVVIGLASVIIGEVVFGTKSLLRRLIAVILGAIVYRIVISFVLELGMPATDLKLISAIIVMLALSMPVINKKFYFYKIRKANAKGGMTDVES